MLRKTLSIINSLVARFSSTHEMIAVGDIVTIRARVGRIFPGNGALSVTPLFRVSRGQSGCGTFILINRAEVHSHKRAAL